MNYPEKLKEVMREVNEITEEEVQDIINTTHFPDLEAEDDRNYTLIIAGIEKGLKIALDYYYKFDFNKPEKK